MAHRQKQNPDVWKRTVSYLQNRFGHFGSTIGRLLRANGVKATILDHDSERVDLLRKMGFKVYYGDATRLELLKAAGAPEPYYFRPPYGKKLFMLPRYLEKHQRIAVTWDVAPENFGKLTQNPQLLAEYTINHTKPGSIILLHVMYDSRANTMAAVPEIIRGLKQRGFQFVTVQQLLKHQPQGY